MSADPLTGVVLDERWVERFERIEAQWGTQAKALTTLARLTSDAVPLAAVTPIVADEVCAGACVVFGDGTEMLWWGVPAPDVAALRELVSDDGNTMVVAAVPEPDSSGWRLQLCLTGLTPTPTRFSMVTASLS